MNDPLDFKNLERKAWNSYYQDGLWDIYLGLLLAILAVPSLVTGEGESRLKGYVIYFFLIGTAYLLFWLGKRFLTSPRLGHVKFSPERRRKKFRLTIILLVFVLVTILFVGLTVAANNDPVRWGRFMPDGLDVWLFVGIFIGGVMALIAYFNDFTRGYYIAAVFAVTFAYVERWDSPLVFLAGSLLVLIPGIVLLVRFLRQHPLPDDEVTHDRPGS